MKLNYSKNILTEIAYILSKKLLTYSDVFHYNGNMWKCHLYACMFSEMLVIKKRHDSTNNFMFSEKPSKIVLPNFSQKTNMFKLIKTKPMQVWSSREHDKNAPVFQENEFCIFDLV